MGYPFTHPLLFFPFAVFLLLSPEILCQAQLTTVALLLIQLWMEPLSLAKHHHCIQLVCKEMGEGREGERNEVWNYFLVSSQVGSLHVLCMWKASLAYCYGPTRNSTPDAHVNMCNTGITLTDWYLTSTFKWDDTRLVSYCLPSQIVCCSFGTNWEGWTGRISPWYSSTVMSYSHTGLWLFVLFLVQDKEQEVKVAPYQNPSQVFFHNFFQSWETKSGNKTNARPEGYAILLEQFSLKNYHFLYQPFPYLITCVPTYTCT